MSKKPTNPLHSSESVEWYTPPEYIELARKVLGSIDLDPASNDIAQQWIKADVYFTQKDDGLTKDWNFSVWLNPPYGSHITKKWIYKLIQEYEKGLATNYYSGIVNAICLVRPAISALWFNNLAERFMRCETYKRIAFIDAKGIREDSPKHGNVFFLLTENNDIKEKFAELFKEIGIISKPYF